MGNQTIDGVPRELLERIISHCRFWHDHPYLEAIQGIDKELRALLDAPACKRRIHQMFQQPVNAEQPAPAAVALPHPKPESIAWGHDMGGNYDEGHADGWNACLDELERLNNL